MRLLRFLLIPVITFFVSSEPVIRGIDVGQVVKGKVIKGDEFPYLVHMEISYKEAAGEEYEYNFNCGGVLIKPKVILTAAHCVSVCGEVTSILVWAGVSNLRLQSNLGQKTYAKYYRVHVDYGGESDQKSPTYMHNDIALIWLHNRFELRDGVQLAKLPKRPVLVTGDKGWSAGWGKTETKETSSVLKKIRMEVLSKNVCEKFYAPSEKSFCALSIKRTSGIGFGDSGGPLQIKGVVAGIISHGCIYFDKYSNGTEITQCDIAKPPVLMDTYKYKKWVEWNINDIGGKIVVASIKKITSHIGKICKKNGVNNVRKVKLNSYFKWHNTTMEILPPVLV